MTRKAWLVSFTKASLGAFALFPFKVRTKQKVTQMINGSMFSVWVVKDLDAFREKVFSDDFRPASDLDKRLHAKILYEEWASLLFGVLGADVKQYREWVKRWRSGETSDFFIVEKYPLLSRLNDNFVDVDYSQDEIQLLKMEAIGLIETQADNLASNLLNVVLDICNQAQQDNLCIYLVCQ